MSPYRMTALVLREPSLWMRLQVELAEFWARMRGRKCAKRKHHHWMVSRYWDFYSYRPDLYVQLPIGLGHDASCIDCGRTLRTFQMTGDVLRACRYMKGADPVRYTGRRLVQEVEPLLLDICLPRDCSTYPRREYQGIPVVEEHDPNDVFHEKYVFEGRAVPEYEDDSC